MQTYDDYLADSAKQRAAYDARYNEIKTGYQQRLQQFRSQSAGITAGYADRGYKTMSMLYGLGQSQRTALADSHHNQMGTAIGMAAKRGMGGTTLEAMRRGVAMDYEKQKIALGDTLGARQAGMYAQLYGDVLGSQERGLSGDMGLQGDMYGFMERKRDIVLPYNAAAMGGPGYGGGRGGGMGPSSAVPMAPKVYGTNSGGTYEQQMANLGNFYQGGVYAPQGAPGRPQAISPSGGGWDSEPDYQRGGYEPYPGYSGNQGFAMPLEQLSNQYGDYGAGGGGSWE